MSRQELPHVRERGLWDPVTGQERGVVFANDGKVLATLDGTVKLWDGSRGR